MGTRNSTSSTKETPTELSTVTVSDGGTNPPEKIKDEKGEKTKFITPNPPEVVLAPISSHILLPTSYQNARRQILDDLFGSDISSVVLLYLNASVYMMLSERFEISFMFSSNAGPISTQLRFNRTPDILAQNKQTPALLPFDIRLEISTLNIKCTATISLRFAPRDAKLNMETPVLSKYKEIAEGTGPMRECILITLKDLDANSSQKFEKQYIVASSSMMKFLVEGNYGPILYRDTSKNAISYCNVVFKKL